LDALVSDLQRTAERFHQSELSDDEREAYSRHLMMVSERLAGVANRVKSQSPVSTLLIVAGDKGAATDDRGAAIRELGNMKERTAVPVLMDLLPVIWISLRLQRWLPSGKSGIAGQLRNWKRCIRSMIDTFRAFWWRCWELRSRKLRRRIRAD